MKNDESLYLQASEEVESADRDPALWAKCMATSEYDEKKAKSKYIMERVRSLGNISKILSEQEAMRLRNGKGWFENLYSGNYGLAKTYWLYGGLVGVAGSILSQFISNGYLVMFVVYSVPYSIAVQLGIWRAANNYRGPRFFVYLAKIAVVLGCISLLVSLPFFLEVIRKPG